MSKTRLIKRLKWYYPAERFHTYVTFPVMLLYLLFSYPIENLVLVAYGLIVCNIILYQGQLYWKLKLERLTGNEIDQEKNIKFFKKSKLINWVLILWMIPVFIFQLYLQQWNLGSNNMLCWGILANLFAIAEHINYYYIQLMVDNQYDISYIVRNKKLKKSSLAKDLKEGRI